VVIKKLLLVALVMMAASPVLALQTGTTAWHSHSYTVPEDIDQVYAVDKYSEYQEKQGMPLGVGLDVKLYEFDGAFYEYGLDSINTEYKWDINNNNQSVFAVVHVNLWQTGRKLLSK